VATQKIYANTDYFMSLLMEQLGVSDFELDRDFILDIRQREVEEEMRKYLL